MIVKVDEVIDDFDSVVDNLRKGVHCKNLGFHGHFLETIITNSKELRHFLIEFCLCLDLLSLKFSIFTCDTLEVFHIGGHIGQRLYELHTLVACGLTEYALHNLAYLHRVLGEFLYLCRDFLNSLEDAGFPRDKVLLKLFAGNSNIVECALC